MAVHLLYVVNRQVVLIVSVVLLENGSDLLLRLVSEWLCVHSLHELDETYASCLLCVELGHNFVGSLSVGVETVLSQHQFEVVGQQHSHPSGVIGVKYFLEIHNILVCEAAGHVKACLELSEVFALETYIVGFGSVDFGLTLIGTVPEFLCGVAIAFSFVLLEGTCLFLVVLSHRHEPDNY